MAIAFSGAMISFHPIHALTQRPARSQISTAVSFEPASERPANSAAIAARSGEDSALSAAEPEGQRAAVMHVQQQCRLKRFGSMAWEVGNLWQSCRPEGHLHALYLPENNFLICFIGVVERLV